MPVDEWVEPVWEGYPWHPSEDEEEIPVLPRGGEEGENDFEREAHKEDIFEWSENTGNLIIYEIINVAAERIDVVIFMDSVRINLTAFGFRIIIPV